MPINSNDRDFMIRTIIGEAGDEPPQGQSAVAHVILNRVATGEWGDSPTSVVLARGQFEPWKTKSRMLRNISPTSPQYQQIGQIVDDAVSGKSQDPTGGATYFLDPKIVRERTGGNLPKWAQGAGMTIGNHTFYNPDNPDYVNVPIRAAMGMLPTKGDPIGDLIKSAIMDNAQ